MIRISTNVDDPNCDDARAPRAGGASTPAAILDMGPEYPSSQTPGTKLYDAFCRFLLARDGELLPGSDRLPNRPLPGGVPPAARAGDAAVAETLTRLYVGERYTVDLAFAKGYFRSNLVEELISREEQFHTELLADAVKALGCAVPETRPPLYLKLILRAIVHVPAFFSSILLFCGEYVAVLLLLAVRDRLENGPPASRAAVGHHVGELLVDEIGHLGYMHARLSPVQHGLARVLLGCLLAVVALREPLMRPLLPDRRSLMAWRALDAVAQGRAFLPALEGGGENGRSLPHGKPSPASGGTPASSTLPPASSTDEGGS
jgi:hypothetical protein